ncbi:MAG: AbrB family transcriptional regulator [Hyphomicrobiaceae bacterium]
MTPPSPHFRKVKFSDLVPMPWRGYLLALMIGAIGATVFYNLRLPLPWFLGALTACLIASVANVDVRRPSFLSVPMRAVLGVAVGSAYTPALFARLDGMVGSLLIMIPYMLMVIGIGMVFYERIGRFDRPTAFFSAVPGGLNDMTIMAEDAGANVRAVILIQASRILVIVFSLPLWLQWHEGFQIATSFANRAHLADIYPADAVLMIALGWGGWWIARRLGLAGAPIVGPMLASGTVHALGLTAAKMPAEVLVTAQICVGTMLGCQFRGLRFREFMNTMTWGIAYALVLVVLTTAIASEVSRLTGFDPISVMLAYAPGGQTELNLLAYVLGLDVAYVALHHLARLAIVILGAQMVFRTHKSWRKS